MPQASSCRRRGLMLLIVLLFSPIWAGATTRAEAERRAAQEAEAEQRLAAVRAQITELSTAREALDGERNTAVRALRQADQAVNKESQALQQIQTDIAAQESELAELEQQHQDLKTRLDNQRQALAVLLRSAYALGRHEQLKLLLAQDRVESLARVMGYHHFVRKGRVARIQALLEQMQALARVQQAIEARRNLLQVSLAQQEIRIAELENHRLQRRNLLADLETRFRDTDTRLRALGKDEQAIKGLLDRLQSIFADIPERLDAPRPFAQRKGQLPRPLSGKTLSAYGNTLPDGRTSRGWLIQASAGAPVQAIAHGRVAFADWLKGYGLIVIIDHGEGWMSLYAQNDSLQREVGDWVAPGDILAHAGNSGGQSEPGLYFELRRNGQPIDPKAWFK